MNKHILSFLTILALSLVTGRIAAQEQQPNMLRFDFDYGELDYTTYDWQTNWGNINRTIVWPDGTVNFAYNYASDEYFSDCGTAIGTYDTNSDEWIPLGGRIEDEKTTFGSIARYKENGIVIASQTATGCGLFIVENKDDMTPNSVPCSLRLDPTNGPYCPVVMTSGPDRGIIHILASGYGGRLYYFRSSDCLTWDMQNVILPYLTEEYGSNFGSHTAYWMETTEDNRLAFVVNNPWSDGMVIYSYDDGITWERKVFWHHPGINNSYDNWFMYPRWTSCLWDNNGELCVAYEFNGSKGEPGSGTYNPAIGGVAFWSETLPYHGEENPGYGYGFDPTNPMPPTPGQPFIMDSAYIFEDIYSSSLYVGNPTHEPWPEYFGFLTELDPFGYPYFSFELSPEELSHHGDYRCGVCAMPVLCKLSENDNNLIAVWMAMDFNFNNGNGYYYKLFASYSFDSGHSWYHQMLLINDFMFDYTEFVYPQAAVVGNKLVLACQADGQTGTFVQGDEDEMEDNYYQGFAIDLMFPHAIDEPTEVEHNTHITVYPNPAVDEVCVTLNKNAEVKICNIMGQTLMTIQGHSGVNRLNISNLNSGIYFVSSGNDTQKFVVK